MPQPLSQPCRVHRVLRHPRSGFSRCLVLLAVSAAVATCTEQIEIDDRPLGDVSPPVVRASDGLLENPAAQGLVVAQTMRDGSTVLAGFGSSSQADRRRASFALASVQAPATRLDLELRLNDPAPRLRQDIAFALGRLGDPEVGPLLLGALSAEADPDVRLALLEALGQVGGSGPLASLLELPLEVGEESARALALARGGMRDLYPAKTVSWLVEQLGNEDPEVRRWAAYFFERVSDPEVYRPHHSVLRAALATLTTDDAAARHLLPALANLGDVTDTPLIASWTRSSTDWRTRAVAVAALRERAGDDVARRALVAALDDPVLHVAEAAGTHLGSSRPALAESRGEVLGWIDAHGDLWQVLEPLMIGLAPLGEGERIAAWYSRVPESDVPQRVAALGALSRVPGALYLEELFSAVEDEEHRVASIAMRGLSGHWGGDREDADLRGRYREAFRTGIRHASPSIVGVAARGLTDPLFLAEGSGQWLEQALMARSPSNPAEAGPTRALVSAFAETRDTTWIPLLQRYLQHPDAAVIEAASVAIQALSNMPGHSMTRPMATGEHLVLDWEFLREAGPRPVVIMETEEGAVTLELAPEEAPLTVQTFLRLVDAGRYDGIPFHRVVPSFVVQGGDVERLDGTGGPGFSIRTELTTIPFQRGVLGMASGGKDTEGSQFFIMHTRAPHLEGRYTSFGWVIEGMDVVDRLNRGETIISMRRGSR